MKKLVKSSVINKKEEFIALLEKHLREDYVVKSETMLLHKKCRHEVRFKQHYLKKILSENKTPRCPYCKLKCVEKELSNITSNL